MSKKSKKSEVASDDLFTIELSSYIKPKLVEYKTQSRGYVLNGRFNSFYDYIDERYDGSPTNSAIIDGYVDRMYGKGLTVINANINAGDYARIMRLLPPKEVRKVLFDYKKYGSAIVQVQYGKGEKRTIATTAHLDRKCVAPSIMNDDGEIESYWFCQDFRRVQTFEPEEFMAYGTSTKEIEILEIRPYKSGRDYFADPDYMSGLQYAKLEEEIANFSVNHIMNGLSAGVVLNFNNGKPTTEVKQDIKRKVHNTLTGSGGAKIIFSFNETKDEGVTVEQLQSDNNTEQWQFWAGEARSQIMVAHKVVSPILFGVRTSTGLGNNANEIEEATKLLNQTVIAPRRMAIIEDFQRLLAFNDISSPLMFKPLEDEAEDIKEDGTEEEKEKIEMNKGFDPMQPRDKNGMWTDTAGGWNSIDTEAQVKGHLDEGGSTYSLDGQDMIGAKGMASVSTNLEDSLLVEGELTKEILDNYIESKKEILLNSQGLLHVGTWLDNNPDSETFGFTYLDLVSVTDRANAVILGREFNQIAVYDLEFGVEIPTGGDGKKTELQWQLEKKLSKDTESIWLKQGKRLRNQLKKWFLGSPKSSPEALIAGADLLIEMGEDPDTDFEIIETREVEGHSLHEHELNISLQLAGLIPGDARKTSTQDTSLFKIRYQYKGEPEAEREFCKKLIKANKVYRYEDLVQAGNMVFQPGMGPEGTDTYSILLYKGGVNCKHFWQRVVYLRKNNKQIGVNEARRLILELASPDRQTAKWEKNRKEVAQIASKSNDFWRYNPKKKVELNEGFDPNQPRDENGMWAETGGLMNKPCFKEWFNESQIKDEDGNPKIMYHQTSKEAFENIKSEGFKIDKPKARLSDEGVPDGVFFKTNDNNISVGGDVQIPVFLAIKNPLRVKTREDLISQVSNWSPEYKALKSELSIKDKGYEIEFNAIWNSLKDTKTEAEDLRKTKEMEAVLEVWQKYVRNTATEMRNILTNELKNRGFDGLRIALDQGSFNRTAETVIAFDAGQIKSIDAQSFCDEKNINR